MMMRPSLRGSAIGGRMFDYRKSPIGVFHVEVVSHTNDRQPHCRQNSARETPDVGGAAAEEADHTSLRPYCARSGPAGDRQVLR
jgi:hypothetical protein